MKRIRISVNLIHYFQDHRQLAKVFVKNDMQTIDDLQNHIVKLFNIGGDFYLMCQNHYLPSEEDIHILNDNDLIFVIPNFNTEDKPIIKKKKKKKLANIESNIVEVDVNVEEKSKKKKKKAIKPNETNRNEEMETNNIEEENVSKKKKKRKKQIDSVEQNHLENEELMETSTNTVIIEKKKKKKLQENVETTNVENFLQEENVSNNLEETRNEMPSTNTVNETIIFRGSNKFDSIFIRQNDDTIKDLQNNSEYNFVNETRRKRRRCISPPIVLPEQESIVVENNENPKKSIVQTIENLSPNEHNELLQNIRHSPRQTYSLGDVLHFKNQTSSSPATNEINKILEKSLNGRPLRSTRKQLSGVGKVLEFIKIEQESDDVSENNESMYSVPKRKRIRTRKRKQKNAELTTESNEHSDQSVFIPPKTIAAPKVHIKFEDNLDTNANSVKENQNTYFHKPSIDTFVSQNGFVHSTPLNKTLENSTKTETSRRTNDFSEIRRISINNINPDELPSMIETPAVNNTILFKKLKLGPDYNPTVSNFILAEIIEIAKNGNELHLKILEGHEELEDPVGGKFSFTTEDEEQNDYDFDKIQILERCTLINPKLVNYFE